MTMNDYVKSPQYVKVLALKDILYSIYSQVDRLIIAEIDKAIAENPDEFRDMLDDYASAAIEKLFNVYDDCISSIYSNYYDEFTSAYIAELEAKIGGQS